MIIQWARAAPSYFSFDTFADCKLHIIINGARQTISLNMSSAEPLYTSSTSQYEVVQVVTQRRDGTNSTFINGIGVLGYGRPPTSTTHTNISTLYQSSFLGDPPVQLVQFSSTLASYWQRSVFLRVIDKSGLSQLNLARTSFNSSDGELSNNVDTLAFAAAIEYVKSAVQPSEDKSLLKRLWGKCLFVPKSSAFIYSKERICPFDSNLMNEY